jgi:hypothetical protein
MGSKKWFLAGARKVHANATVCLERLEETFARAAEAEQHHMVRSDVLSSCAQAVRISLAAWKNQGSCEQLVEWLPKDKPSAKKRANKAFKKLEKDLIDMGGLDAVADMVKEARKAWKAGA